MFAMSVGVRPDLAYPIGICARTATFPTVEMEACLDHAIVYGGQTASDGVTFGVDACARLEGYCDSDWHVSHSTSAQVHMYGRACVHYASRRQQCIAMSSTEAAIIAASTAALETVHLRALAVEMGAGDDEGPTVLHCDNAGAVELAKHRKSCQRSRHVKRRYFKVRELVAEGEIEVCWIDTSFNISDMLSKGTLDAPTFKALKAQVMEGAPRSAGARVVGGAVG